MRPQAFALLVVLAACSAPPAAPPELDARTARAAEVADGEAARLLGSDVRPVLREAPLTLRAIYGARADVAAAADDPGLFAVYASPGSGLFAEVFVGYDGMRVTFSSVTRDPIRR